MLCYKNAFLYKVFLMFDNNVFQFDVVHQCTLNVALEFLLINELNKYKYFKKFFVFLIMIFLYVIKIK